MNYSSFRRRSRISPSTFIGILFVAIVIAVSLAWRSGARSLVWEVLTPIVAVRNAIDYSQLEDLRAQLASTTAALAEVDVLRSDNARLEAELGRSKKTDQATLAGVLMAPPTAAYDTLVIDAGTVQGISIGQHVSAGGDTIIGTVTAVSSDTAQVTLLSAPGSMHDALIVSKQSGATVPISMAGQGGGSFTGQLPAGTTVTAGDSVVFVGIAGEFVARVTAVDARAGESFVTLYMHMPVNIFDLRYVEVMH